MRLPTRARLVLLACCALVAVAAPAWAERPANPLLDTSIITEQARLLASDGELLTGFGYSVAFSGDTAVVGAGFGYNPDEVQTGVAYVFVRSGSTWSEQAKLFASDGWRNAAFGASVAISGDTVLIGAPSDPTPGGQGSAYVFVRSGSTWSEQAKLIAFSDPRGFRVFGSAVALDGDTAVVGAPGEWRDTYGSVGAAYVFVREGSSWSEQARLVTDWRGSDELGSSAAISGDSVALGAYGRGAVYVFVRSGSIWSEQARLLALDGGRLGQSVAISGDSVAAGAEYAHSPTTEYTGAAYIFIRSGSGWFQQAKLFASDRRQWGAFGRAVALSGDTLVVSAPGQTAYVFLRVDASWYETARLLPSNFEDFRHTTFGDSVALSEETVLVGAKTIRLHTETESQPGAVYVFSLVPAPGVTVVPATGLLTTEWGGTATFIVALNGQPAGDVVIDLASSDPGEGAVSAAQLTFPLDDWSTPQAVHLTGVYDSVLDGNQPYTALVSMNTDLTADPVYDGIDPPDVAAVNLGLEGDFYAMAPCRALDTRQPGQGPGLVNGVKRPVLLHGVCGIPATAGAVAINAIVVQPSIDGNLKLSPGDLAPSGLIALTFGTGETRSTQAILPLSIDGTGALAVWPILSGGGSADLVIDVSGYFE